MGDRLRGGVFSSGLRGMAPSEWRRMDRRTFPCLRDFAVFLDGPQGRAAVLCRGLARSFGTRARRSQRALLDFFFLATLGPRPIMRSIIEAIVLQRGGGLPERSRRGAASARWRRWLRGAARRLGRRTGCSGALNGARHAETLRARSSQRRSGA